MALLRRSKGKPYTGKVRRTADRNIVKWPGDYGTKKDGSVNTRCPVIFDRAAGIWRRA